MKVIADITDQVSITSWPPEAAKNVRVELVQAEWRDEVRTFFFEFRLAMQTWTWNPRSWKLRLNHTKYHTQSIRVSRTPSPYEGAFKIPDDAWGAH